MHKDDEMRGCEGEKKTTTIKVNKAVRRLKTCRVPRFVEPKQLKQIWVLVKSRMPEVVEPKQLEQTRGLVKHARLTAERSAATPNARTFP